MKFTPAQVHWFRLRRSGLVEPFATPEETSRQLLGVQAQLMPAAHLAFWNRTAPCSIADLEAARLKHRSLVRFWGQRNTVHLYSTDDWPFLHTSFEERRSLLERRFEKAGLLEEFHRLVRRTRERLEQGETLTYKDIQSKVLEEGQDKWVVSYVVFMQLVREGVTCHGPDQGKQSGFVHRRQWCPDLDFAPPSPEVALPTLAQRYLAAYGPAEDHDLAFWCGTTLTKARSWLQAAGEKCSIVEMDGRTLWFCRGDLEELRTTPPAPSRWPVRLLYRFDPLLLGTKDKSWLIDEEHYKKVWRPAAHVEAVLLVRGRIAGVWRYDRKAKGLSIRLQPFAKLSKTVLRAAEQQGKGIAKFLGLELRNFDVVAP